RDTQRRETALSSLSSLFLLSCSLAHRDLHSFPTRRSSDLSLFGEAGQALLYARVLRAFAARRSWWTGVSFYDLHDDPIAGDCGSAITRADWSNRPAFLVYQQAIRTNP